MLALTATAAAPVRREIIAELRMDDPFIASAGIVRPQHRVGGLTTSDLDAATDVASDVADREGLLARI